MLHEKFHKHGPIKRDCTILGDSSRRELKFLLNKYLFYNILQELKLYLVLDEYSQLNGSYLVKSLYFDDYQFKNYWDKINGEENREILRLRTYNDDYSVGYIEVKEKRGEISLKKRFKVMDSSNWNESLNNSFSLKEFRPVIWVKYRRIAFASPFNSQLKVTIDGQIMSAMSLGLRPMDQFYKNICNLAGNEYILEIKFKHTLPLWLSNILIKNKLRTESISKYKIAMQEQLGAKGYL